MENSRFKFRAWYKNPDGKYEMIYDVQASYDNLAGGTGSVYHFNFQDVINDEDAVIEQCTGLTDKNGKLIYEGDVVRVEDECGICDPMMNCDTRIGVISWVRGMWYIARNVNLGLYDAKQVNYIEIIGNIHEQGVEK